MDRSKSGRTRALLTDAAGSPLHLVAAFGCTGVLPPTGPPAPGHDGVRWVVERTHRWLNDFGRLRRCPERRAAVVHRSLFLAASIIVIQHLLRAAFHDFRWSTRATTRRLR